MDINLQSAALIVPHFRSHLSVGINAIKDNFFAGDEEADETSLEFLLPDDPEIIDFHHQEIVDTSSTPPDATVSPIRHVNIDDLDLFDTNDLFSFILDSDDSTKSLLNPKSVDSLASAFHVADTDQMPANSCDSFTPSYLDLFDQFSSNTINSDLIDELPGNLWMTSESSNILHVPVKTNNSVCSQIPENPFPSSMSSTVDFYTEESGLTDDEYSNYEIGRNSEKFLSDHLHNEDLKKGKPGQPLILSNEEKRILSQMGEKIPKTFPLKRDEERAIRLMRRKIRNKMSAKSSRARRQEYLCTLESRISSCHKVNHRLRRRIAELEMDKLGLMTGLRKMRSYVARLISGIPLITSSVENKQPLLPITISQTSSQIASHSSFSKSRTAASGTSLLVIAFMILAWATLMPLPHLELGGVMGSNLVAISHANPVSGRSRTLLMADVPEKLNKNYIPSRTESSRVTVKIKNLIPRIGEKNINQEIEDSSTQFLNIEPVQQIPLSFIDL